MSDEYDAFGRKRDEAGLGDLGWGSSGDPDAVPNAEPAAPTQAPAVSAADSGFSSPQEFKTVITSGSTPHTWRPRRNPFVWAIQLLILGGIAFAIYSVVDAGSDAVQGVRDSFNTLDDFGNGAGSGQGSGDQGDDTVPEQVQARKLFTPDGLRSAIKVMEKELPGRVANFSIRREYISAQIIKGEKRSIVHFTADAEVPDVTTTVPMGAVSDTFSYEEINPTAMRKLMNAANRRLGQSEADVDYFIASKTLGEMQWGVYYEGGSPIAIGDSRGRYLRRIS